MTRSASPPPSRTKERGVYELPYIGPTGETVLVLIASNGRRLTEWLVPLGDDVRQVWDALTVLLDAIDPPTAERSPLALVRGAARASTPAAARRRASARRLTLHRG